MLKSEIQKFLSYLNNKNPSDLIFNFPHWKWAFDEVSLLVWWILCWIKDIDDIRLKHKILATKFITTNFDLNEAKKKMPLIISEVKWKIEGVFEKNLNDPKFFEYFIVDFLLRNIDKSKINYVLMWDTILDNKLATDFIFNINHNWKPINFWTQLTTWNYNFIEKKVQKMIELRNKLEKWDKKTIEDLSAKIQPNMLAMLSVNWAISKAYKEKKKIFWDAYKKWKDNWYSEWWPNQFLEQEIKEIFELINHFLPQMTNYFLLWLENNFESVKTKVINFNWKKYFLKLNYIEEKDIFSIPLYEKWDWWEENFIFSMDFTQSRHPWKSESIDKKS